MSTNESEPAAPAEPVASATTSADAPAGILKSLKGAGKKAPAPAPAPPFAKGARVRYVGGNRMFVGYQMFVLLEPGREFTIADVAGGYSFCSTELLGVEYNVVISEKTKSEWELVPDANL